MNCRFCAQWTPPGSSKCAFCCNAIDGDSDRTAAGRVQLDAEQLARIPKHVEQSPLESLRELGGQLWKADGEAPIPRLAIALLVGGMVVIILGFLWRC